ncbi:MAG: hypothetical protein EBZ77_05930 [Chitinophagia bacterium]|nr:hypothetical protein [Chitinophagia bacterium]
MDQRKSKTTPVAAAAPAPTYTYKVVTADSTDPSYLISAPFGINVWRHGQLLIMNMKGEIVYQQLVPGMTYGFRPWTIDGKTYYSYIINDTDTYHIPRIALTAGYAVLLDSNLNEIKRLHLAEGHGLQVPAKQGLDLHDIILLSENHYYVSAVYVRPGNNIPDSVPHHPNIKVASLLIQEINNGQLVWQWDASKYPEFYATSLRHNHFNDTTMVQDFMHFNTLIMDPYDSNLVCSFRDMNQVIKIDRHSGKILWRLGGRHSDYALQPGQVFLGQHNVTITGPHQYMMLDNGDTVTRKRSRIAEFTLDEARHTVTAYKATDLPSPFVQQMGSIAKTSKGFLIGGGIAGYVVEADPVTGKKSFELTATMPSYRVYKVPHIAAGILEKGRRNK